MFSQNLVQCFNISKCRCMVHWWSLDFHGRWETKRGDLRGRKKPGCGTMIVRCDCCLWACWWPCWCRVWPEMVMGHFHGWSWPWPWWKAPAFHRRRNCCYQIWPTCDILRWSRGSDIYCGANFLRCIKCISCRTYQTGDLRILYQKQISWGFIGLWNVKCPTLCRWRWYLSRNSCYAFKLMVN